jgi:hypothetical protein
MIVYDSSGLVPFAMLELWPFVNTCFLVINLGLLLAIFFIVRGQKGLSSGVGVVPTIPMEKPPQSGPNSTFVKGSKEDVGIPH